MELRREEKEAYAVKITAYEGGEAVGWAHLFLISHDRHDEPYGLMEMVYVRPEFRNRGVGTELVRAVVEEAKRRGCYKIIGTSRMSREHVHALYERLGFKRWGFEFRMDLKESESKQED